MLRYTWDLVQEIENERLGRRFGLWDAKLGDPAGNFYDQLKDIHDGILACVMETNAGGGTLHPLDPVAVPSFS